MFHSQHWSLNITPESSYRDDCPQVRLARKKPADPPSRPLIFRHTYAQQRVCVTSVPILDAEEYPPHRATAALGR